MLVSNSSINIFTTLFDKDAFPKPHFPYHEAKTVYIHLCTVEALCLPSITSGAMYKGVPHTVPVILSLKVARPKSATLMCSRFEIYK